MLEFNFFYSLREHSFGEGFSKFEHCSCTNSLPHIRQRRWLPDVRPIGSMFKVACVLWRLYSHFRIQITLFLDKGQEFQSWFNHLSCDDTPRAHSIELNFGRFVLRCLNFCLTDLARFDVFSSHICVPISRLFSPIIHREGETPIELQLLQLNSCCQRTWVDMTVPTLWRHWTLSTLLGIVIFR